jgi:RHS repeat-associated protein
MADRSIGRVAQAWLARLVVLALVAGALVVVPGVASPPQVGAIPQGTICSGGKLQGSFWDPDAGGSGLSGRDSGTLWVPAGSTVTVTGVVRNTGSVLGGDLVWDLSPLTDGTTALGTPTTVNDTWTNNGASQLVDVEWSYDQALFAYRYDWDFHFLVEAGQTCAPDPLETLGDNPAEPHADDAQGEEGDPVNTATGNFHLDQVDLAIEGRGPGLGLGRFYNSLDAGRVGAFGPGWSFSYGMSLDVDTGTGDAVVIQETGARVPFGLTNGDWVPPGRAVATLVEETSGDWTFTRNGRETFTFDSTGRLTAIADLNGYTTTLAYDGSGKLETVTDHAVADPLGRSLSFTWTGDRVTSVTDPEAREVSFGYDGSGRLETVTDVAGGEWRYGYDGSGRLSTVRDPNQEGVGSPPVLSNDYDIDGRVTLQTDRLGETTTFDYSVPGETTITDPEGNVTVDEYTDGLRTRTTKGAGTLLAASWEFEYDPFTLGITKVTDPRGKVWTSSYDDRGNRTRTSDPLSRSTSATYNAWNLPDTTVDGERVTTTYVYDANGNVESVSTPLVGSSPAVSRTVEFDYADLEFPGDVTSMTDPRGKVWAYGYDDNGYRDEVTDPLGKVATAEFDEIGWLQSTVSPRGNELGANPADFMTQYTYTPHGDVDTIAGPENLSIDRDYDANRNLTSETNAEAQTTGYVYDDNDRLVEVHRPDTTVLVNEYYDNGWLYKQIDAAAQETVFEYDPIGRLATQTNPLGEITSYGYDPSGNLLTRQDPGGNCAAGTPVGCVTFDYDDANQLAGIDYSEAGTPDITAVTYDDNGRRTSATDAASQVTSWAWDSLGYMTSSSSAGRTTTYGLDLAGNVTSIQAPTGPTVTRVFDDTGRLDTVNDGASRTTDFSYDADSNWTTTTYPSSVNADTYGYDNAGRMTSATYRKGGTTLASLTFSRDDLGLVTGEDLTSLPGTDSTYTYSDLNQLATRNSQPYTYNAANSLTGLEGRTQAFNAGGQLCWVATTGGSDCNAPPTGATTFTYDERGNRTTKTPADGISTAYGYDQANRLTTAIVPSEPGGDGQYHAVTPARILDTRAGSRTGLCPTTTPQCTTIPTGGTRSLQVTGQGGVPASGVGAVAVTITVLAGPSAGFITTYPTGQTRPTASTVNYAASEVIANSAIVQVGQNGRIDLFAHTSADILVDVTGWYADPQGASGSLFYPVTPSRAIDTRTGSGLCPGTCGPVGTGATKQMTLAGAAGVPASGATAVAVNVTVVNSTAGGYLSVYGGTPQSPPPASNIQYPAGGVLAQMVIVQLGSGGTINVYAHAQTDVIIDVAGYFTDDLDAGGNKFVATNPVRYMDTRESSMTGLCVYPPIAGYPCWAPGANQFRRVVIAGRTSMPVPASATAVAINITVPEPTTPGFVTIYPGGTSRPNVSNVNYTAGRSVSNSAIVKLGGSTLDVYTQTGVNVIIDVVGWFEAPTETWTYGYDSDGLRTTKTGPSGTTTYDWDKSSGIPLLLAETTGTAVTRYVYGPGGQPFQQINPDGSATYLHHDQLGSIRLLTNSAGNQTGAATYKPYGKLDASTGTVSRLGYAGEYTDPETGLQYLRARYYEPESGQFLSRDPLVNLTNDPYGYTGGNPLNDTDPTGLAPASWWEKAARFGAQVVVIGVGVAGAAACGASVVCGVIVGAGVGFGSYSSWNAGTDHWSWWDAGVSTVIGGATGGVGAKFMPGAAGASTSKVMLNSSRQLQSKFKHAADFGVIGNYSKASASKFSSALNQHINSSSVTAIQGTYRGTPVIHHVDKSTGLNVITDRAGTFISGWKLSPDQLANILTHGGL